MKSLLKSKNKLNIPRKAGVKNVHVFAEGVYEKQTVDVFSFKETYYYEEKATVANPMFGMDDDSPETIEVTNRIILETEVQHRPMSDINSFFNAYGSDITKTNGYATGIEDNFKIIFSTVVKMNENYGVLAADWETVI